MWVMCTTPVLGSTSTEGSCVLCPASIPSLWQRPAVLYGGPMLPGILRKLLATAVAVATAMRRYRSTKSACSTQVTAFELHWIPVQRAMSIKFSPPMTLLARRAISVVAAAAAGTFLATVTSTRCSRPYTNCVQTVQISSKQPARPYATAYKQPKAAVNQPASPIGKNVRVCRHLHSRCFISVPATETSRQRRMHWYWAW